MNVVASNAAAGPGSLSSSVLAARLAELCGEERNVQVEFLLHLAEFDTRHAWAEAGYGSLWTYCLEVLHLREGAAWRRIEAMKLLRRFPSVEPALRGGRLCMTTLNLLAPILTYENVADLVTRAAFLSKGDTERLVASIKPRVAPGDGIRKLAGDERPATLVASAPEAAAALSEMSPLTLAPASDNAARGTAVAPAPVAAPPPPARAELRPVSGDTYSLRVTLDAASKADLDQLVSLLSHKHRGDLAAVLREAIRCGIANHGKRRGAIEPERKGRKVVTASAPQFRGDARAIPMEVMRKVWRRDGGRCAWTSLDGKRCESTWKLEFRTSRRSRAAGGRPRTTFGSNAPSTTSTRQTACSGASTWRGSAGRRTSAGGSNGP